MRKMLFMLLALAALSARAQNRKIHFEEGNLASVLAKAKAEGKFVFMDAYTTWCGPCKWMDKNVFTNDTVADYFNQHFVNYKLDMEKGEGLEVAKKYEVRAYPNLVFIDGDGNLVHRAAGSRAAHQFVQLGKDAQNAEVRFAAYQQKYESGLRDPQFMTTYLELRERSALPFSEVAKAYFATQKQADLITPGNWRLLYRYLDDPSSPAFAYLEKNQAAFAKKYTADSVQGKLLNVYAGTLYAAIKANDDAGYLKAKQEFSAKNLKGKERAILGSDIQYYKKKADMKNYAASVVQMVEKYQVEDPNQLNSYAWAFYENVTDKAMLQKAESWAALAAKKAPGYAVLDTQASLLYKLGRKAEARAAAEKAIALGEKESQDVAETRELLKKIDGLQ